ncbi:MAG TPA: hypothetical protein VGH15_05900 [Caulobacteraceae bacterium]|jgi:hypothetical protein
MTDGERRALGLTRRLAFENIARGLPMERVQADLKLSQLEVEQAVAFVARKLTQHLVLRRQPPIACDCISAILRNRKRLLILLARLGDLDLSTDLILGKITIQRLDHPEMLQGVSRRMGEARYPPPPS